MAAKNHPKSAEFGRHRLRSRVGTGDTLENRLLREDIAKAAGVKMTSVYQTLAGTQRSIAVIEAIGTLYGLPVWDVLNPEVPLVLSKEKQEDLQRRADELRRTRAEAASHE